MMLTEISHIKWKILWDSAYRGFPEASNSQRHRVEGCLPGVEGKERGV